MVDSLTLNGEYAHLPSRPGLCANPLPCVGGAIRAVVGEQKKSIHVWTRPRKRAISKSECREPRHLSRVSQVRVDDHLQAFGIHRHAHGLVYVCERVLVTDEVVEGVSIGVPLE